MRPSINLHADLENGNKMSLGVRRPGCGFTFIELLVVLGAVAALALAFMPALASTKIDTWRIQCQSNLKQLAAGFQLFPQDHDNMFPPAGDQANGGQLSWDAYIHQYFGDTNSDLSWTKGVLLAGPSLAGIAAASPIMEKIEVCPADRFPKVSWITGPPAFALRSYAMNSVGNLYGTTYEVSDANRTYPLPDLNNTNLNCHGIGIYWQSIALLPDWHAKGYKTTVVEDPGSTILLAENTHGQQCMGNIWTCCTVGPYSTNLSDLYQIDGNTTPQNPNSATGVNQGNLLYSAHMGRFNYAFHDGHVAALKIEQTVGTGTIAAPKGMWTVTRGD